MFSSYIIFCVFEHISASACQSHANVFNWAGKHTTVPVHALLSWVNCAVYHVRHHLDQINVKYSWVYKDVDHDAFFLH